MIVISMLGQENLPGLENIEGVLETWCESLNARNSTKALGNPLDIKILSENARIRLLSFYNIK